jgi:hypothetical protein
MINSKIFTVGSSNNTIKNNYLDQTIILIQGSYNITGNLIKHNTFINTGILVDYNPIGTDIITENNFYNSRVDYALSDSPMLDRNYWSNYTTLYPNAKEIENTGVWNTPYAPEDPNEGVHSAIDNNPLVNPLEDFSSYFSLHPESTPTPIPTSTSDNSQTALPSTLEIVLIVILVVVALALAVNIIKKRSI